MPLMGILGLPNLPIDFPAQPACQVREAVLECFGAGIGSFQNKLCYSEEMGLVLMTVSFYFIFFLEEVLSFM